MNEEKKKGWKGGVGCLINFRMEKNWMNNMNGEKKEMKKG
jgi:hypothetical protein